jgi:hypothetical protein
MALSLLAWSNNLSATDLCADDTSSNVAHVPRADVTHNPQGVFDVDPIDIPITIDLIDRYDLDVSSGVELDAPVGFISVYKDGRILHDGKDISGDIKDQCENDSTSPDTDEQPESDQSENGDNTNP